MATPAPNPSGGASRRRLVLIDFDWEDADIVPDLLRQPDISVRLVAGSRTDEPGLRVAELCSLPRTVDLADLTREIFDLALVGERSPRRTQVEGLLQALGTPCASPRTFLSGQGEIDDSGPGVEAPLAMHAAALEDALGGENFEAVMEQMLPDLDENAPTTPQPVQPTGRSPIVLKSLDDFPSTYDRKKLESALREMMQNTGAERAEVRTADKSGMQTIAQVGPDDPLLKGLVELAMRFNMPQVVTQIAGPEEGKAWGAWPFQTTQRRGVVAAAAIDPASGWSFWQQMVDDLRSTWDRQDREKAVPAFPMLPERSPGWLGADEFRTRLDLAVERNARDGLAFAVHRLRFSDAPASVELLCTHLPAQLRDTDCICHPSPNQVLLLTAGASATFPHLRRRLLALWEQAWHDGHQSPPAPPITDERVEMLGPEDAPAFLATVDVWLSRI
jgi:hypothetical protein